MTTWRRGPWISITCACGDVAEVIYTDAVDEFGDRDYYVDRCEHSDGTQRWVRLMTRAKRGYYDTALPSPEDRKRIREAAGLTQADVADALHVSRDLISKFEQFYGWTPAGRLPGREPYGQIRYKYGHLLRQLESGTRNVTE